MEKLEEASAMSRGSALPMVTFMMADSEFDDAKLVVVHAAEPLSLQSDPPKPFVQMHEHDPWDKTFVPPFWHTRSERHCSSCDWGSS